MARFQPTFWAETYNRLHAAPGHGPIKPLTLIRLHRPISCYFAGAEANAFVPYYPEAESVESEQSEASEHDVCSCGDHISDCGGTCGECGYHTCECCGECGLATCECEEDESDDSEVSQEDAMSEHGSGPVSIVRGGDYGWRVKWAGDPQPRRDRSFRTEDDALACKRAIETYMAQGTFLGAGRHRAGWLVGGLTVKVAMSAEGMTANRSEVELSKDAPVPVPETAPLDRVTILAEYAPRLPKDEAYRLRFDPNGPFVSHNIDCDDFGYQLGRLPNGNVVCFDFSTN